MASKAYSIVAFISLTLLVSQSMCQEGALCHTNIITPRHFFEVPSVSV